MRSVYSHTNVTRVVKILILNISQGKELGLVSKNNPVIDWLIIWFLIYPHSSWRNQDRIILIMLMPRGPTLIEILCALVHACVKLEINLTCNSVIFWMLLIIYHTPHKTDNKAHMFNWFWNLTHYFDKCRTPSALAICLTLTWNCTMKHLLLVALKICLLAINFFINWDDHT